MAIMEEWSMKAKLKDLYPNPYKNWISEGQLNEEQVKKLEASLDKLGLMGSIPVTKIDDKLCLISHHHRVAAMKNKYGDDYEVEVTIHDYNKEQLFRGMVVENLTQRQGEFREETQNLVAIRKYLKENPTACPDSGHADDSRKDTKGIMDAGSIRNIEAWLNDQGEIMARGKIHSLLQIHDKLDPELQEKIEKVHSGDADRRTDEDVVPLTRAVQLSTFDDPDEQKDLAKALNKSSEQRVREQSKLLSKYKRASEEEKDKIRSGKKDIALVDALPSDFKKTEKSPTEQMREFMAEIRAFSQRCGGVAASGLIEELNDEQRALLSEFLVSFRNNVLDNLVKELGK